MPVLMAYSEYKDIKGELNDCLNDGWKVVMVTPKPDYNEYIIEKEVENEAD